MQRCAVGSTVLTYSYDNAGNRTQETVGGTTNSFSYTSGTNKLSSAVLNGTTYSYSYDDVGNIISKAWFKDQIDNCWDYNYNYSNLLAKVTLNGSRTVTNYYGVGGTTRVKKTDSQLGSRYYGPLTEHDSTGAVKKKYIYALGKCIAFVDSVNGTHWMHQDAQGSTKLITNASGTAENAYKYYPFGDSLNFTGTVKNDVKFTGQRYADGIEAYDFNARYYDPELGRFYSRDPLGNAAISPYAYCGNNPVNFTDPSGMVALPFNPDIGGGPGGGGGDGEWLITDKQTGQRTWTGTGDPYYGLPAGGLGFQGHIEWDEVTKSYIDPETGELMTKTETYGYYVSDRFTDASGNSFDTHYTSGYMAHGRLDGIINGIINGPKKEMQIAGIDAMIIGGVLMNEVPLGGMLGYQMWKAFHEADRTNKPAEVFNKNGYMYYIRKGKNGEYHHDFGIPMPDIYYKLTHPITS